jgi:hypothetical protein
MVGFVMTEPIAEEISRHYVMPREWRHTFAVARSAIARDDLAAALPILEEIATALPDDLEVKLYARWVHDRLAKGGATSDEVEHKQEEEEDESLDQLAGRALAQRKALALPLAILGHAALRRGEAIIARALFRAAIQADPLLLDAERGLAIAERRAACAAHESRAHLTYVALALAAAAGFFAFLSQNADIVMR